MKLLKWLIALQAKCWRKQEMTILLDFMYTQLKEPIDNKISIDSDIK